ncbi:MAG: hypothetical protein JXR89_12800 [Deltaproteobacteria bacterium]|nr:hypothetical protein [Deltaproteobacteria bacterium]
MNFINYLSHPQMQEAGNIAFLLALGLILGGVVLALCHELSNKNNSEVEGLRFSRKLTGSILPWIIVFFIGGAGIVFLPLRDQLCQNPFPLRCLILAGAALILFLLYHFSLTLIKNRFFHLPSALLAGAGALGAAFFLYLPETGKAWSQMQSEPASSREIFFWWFGRIEIAHFIHFVLNAISLTALIFMLANAGEKEQKRKQSREYYFQAAAYVGKWLLVAVFLQILPLSWQLAGGATERITASPTIYWFAGFVFCALCGWLLLIKITKDGLVNRRATLIIAIFLLSSLIFYRFSPLHKALEPQSGPALMSTGRINPGKSN